MKTCTKCGEEKSLECYSKNRDSLRPSCKDCCNLSHREYRHSNIHEYRLKEQDKKAKARYGISGEEYRERMSSSQCCGICDTRDNLCYDHDHETMDFRGVLCNRCNRAVGLLGDNEEGLIRALEYLRR